jgi:hypothetical protein
MEVSSSLLVERMFVMILSIRIGSCFFGRFWLDGRLLERQAPFIGRRPLRFLWCSSFVALSLDPTGDVQADQPGVYNRRRHLWPFGKACIHARVLRDR